MLGHIMEWFYSGLAGIGQEEGSVAYNHIRIRPQPVGDITNAKGSFHSPYGWIRTAWTKNREKFELRVHIPVNAKATVYLPATVKSKVFVNGKVTAGNTVAIKENSALVNVGSGDYVFEVR